MKGIAMNVDLLLIGFELQLMMKGMHSFHRECMERLDVLSAERVRAISGCAVAGGRTAEHAFWP